MADLPKIELEQMRGRIRELTEEGADSRTKAASRYVYARSLVTFFDILGFAEIAQHRSAADVGEILDVLQDSIGPPFKGMSSGPRTIGFSDSIVRVVSLKGNRLSLRVLRDELLEVLYAQLTLALTGVFVRGGMSVGNLYVDEAKMFGPGLVRSHELETNFATYPRIIIDPDLIETVDDNAAATNLKASIASLVGRADDGAHFGNYLGLLKELMSPEEQYEKLFAHKIAVVKGIKSFSDAPFSRAKLKYTWVARYHNRYCNEVDANDDCIITFEDVGLRKFPDLDDD